MIPIAMAINRRASLEYPQRAQIRFFKLCSVDLVDHEAAKLACMIEHSEDAVQFGGASPAAEAAVVHSGVFIDEVALREWCDHFVGFSIIRGTF